MNNPVEMDREIWAPQPE